MKSTRRRFLVGAAGVGTVGLAGCLGSLESLFRDTDAREEAEAVENPHRERDIGDVPPDTDLPLRDREVPLAYDLSEFEAEADWGGVGKDGIPSIDTPQFGTVEDGDALVETTVSDVPYLAAYHPELDSAWIYRNPENRSVTADDGRYVVDDTRYDVDSPPLTSVNAFDAMWLLASLRCSLVGPAVHRLSRRC